MVGNRGGLAARANYPWIMIGLLWLVAFLNAADRNILLAVLPDLKAEFDLTDTQTGAARFGLFLDLCRRGVRRGAHRRQRPAQPPHHLRPGVLERRDRCVQPCDRLCAAAFDARIGRDRRIDLLSHGNRADRRLAQAPDAQPGTVAASDRGLCGLGSRGRRCGLYCRRVQLARALPDLRRRRADSRCDAVVLSP